MCVHVRPNTCMWGEKTCGERLAKGKSGAIIFLLQYFFYFYIATLMQESCFNLSLKNGCTLFFPFLFLQRLLLYLYICACACLHPVTVWLHPFENGASSSFSDPRVPLNGK